MITLDGIPKNQSFGVHCPTLDSAEIFIKYVESKFPDKKNTHMDLLACWHQFKEDTVYYPHLDDLHKMNYGRVGGAASFRRRIYEFNDLVMIAELPIEQSDIPVFDLLGL